jgi:myo-inositol-1(or 4)-monophosphatase
VVREVGTVAADHFARRELLTVDRKGARDLVSEADRTCEVLIVAGLAHRFPRDGIFGEGRGSRNQDAAAVWVIDPIDGTHNFLTGIPFGACQSAWSPTASWYSGSSITRLRGNSARRKGAAAPF